MNGECYRVLVFRYVLVIAFGCYIAIREMDGNMMLTKKSIRLGTIALMAGMCFIVLYEYVGIRNILCGVVIYYAVNNAVFYILQRVGK